MNDGWTVLLFDREAARSRGLFVPRWAPAVALGGLVMLTALAAYVGYALS